MADLKDYRGPFKQDLKLIDFGKDVMVRLWHASARNYGQRTGEWHRLIRDRNGEPTAREVVRNEVWQHQNRMLNIESRLDAEALSFKERDLIGFLKSLQWDPGQQGFLDTQVDLVDGNPYHARLSISKCWIYDYCWQSGDFDYLDSTCDLDLHGYQEIARWFHPHIKTVFLKGPSKDKKDDIACQYEFFIPGKTGKMEVMPLKDYSGPELKDYSGDFMSGQNTDETAKKFSKEALVAITEAGGRLTCIVDGIYTSACQFKWNRRLAYEMENEQWHRTVHVDMRRVREAVGIEGTDVGTLFKYYQCMPAFVVRCPDVEYMLNDEHHGTLTIKHCRSLDYCVRHGQDALQKHLCESLDVEGFQEMANCVNPRIKVSPLKLPARQRNAWNLWFEEGITGPEECKAVAKELLARTDWPGLEPIACQWEFRMQ